MPGACTGLGFSSLFHPCLPPELDLEELCPQRKQLQVVFYLVQHKLGSVSSNWDSMFSGQSRGDPFFSCSLKEGNENASFSVVRHKMYCKKKK